MMKLKDLLPKEFKKLAWITDKADPSDPFLFIETDTDANKAEKRELSSALGEYLKALLGVIGEGTLYLKELMRTLSNMRMKEENAGIITDKTTYIIECNAVISLLRRYKTF